MPPTTITLDLYALLYSVDAFRLPQQTEVDALVDLTESYLDEFFTIVFDSSGLAELEGTTTVEDETIVRFGQPVQIRYLTDLTFASSSQIPPIGELNGLLASAFRGDNLDTYETLVQGLPQSNIFSTTTAVEFSELSASAEAEAASPTSSATTSGIAAAAGAGAFFIVVAGLVLYRRREVGADDGKYLDGDGDGHMTVAGETYAGSSLDSQSGIHQTSRFCDGESIVSPKEWSDYQDASVIGPVQKIDEGNASGTSSLGETSDESDGEDSERGSQEPQHLEEVTL
jgi:hypothetical protein